MNNKKKICDGCGNESYIWKTEDRLHYCKYCWLKRHPVHFKPASDKKKQQDVIYLRLRKEFLNKPENQFCKAHLEGCTLVASDIHHIKGRLGDLLCDINYFLPVCRNCHRIIENTPELAKELGFSQNRL